MHGHRYRERSAVTIHLVRHAGFNRHGKARSAAAAAAAERIIARHTFDAPTKAEGQAAHTRHMKVEPAPRQVGVGYGEPRGQDALLGLKR
jgi:hypothetical protein